MNSSAISTPAPVPMALPEAPNTACVVVSFPATALIRRNARKYADHRIQYLFHNLGK